MVVTGTVLSHGVAATTSKLLSNLRSGSNNNGANLCLLLGTKRSSAVKEYVGGWGDNLISNDR